MKNAVITTMPEAYRPHRRWKKFLLLGLLLPIIAGAILYQMGVGEVPDTHASRTYLQTATDWAKIDNFISAEFLKTPEPGNLLVAVVSNSPAAEIQAPQGWSEAVNESEFTPGQAVFYKIATQNESRVVTVSHISRRVNLGLQIFEYPDVDSANPIDVVASVNGQGQVLHSGTLKTTADKDLLVAAFTVSRKENFDRVWDNNFSFRNIGQTKGDGLISFAVGDYITAQAGSFDTAVALDSPVKWRGQIVAFHRLDQTLQQAVDIESADVAVALSVSNENPEPGEAITYTLVTRNNGAQDLNNVFVQSALPKGVSLYEAGISQGRYAPGVGMWEIGDLAQGQAATLNLHAYVDQRTYGTSVIARASLYIMEQVDFDETNNESYAVIDIQKVVGAKYECPPIANITFALALGQATTDVRSVAVQANAAGATYLLLSENPNRQAAAYYPLSANLNFELSPQPGLKTVYAWFMNACGSSPVQQAQIEYSPKPIVIEEVPVEVPVAATVDVITLPPEAAASPVVPAATDDSVSVTVTVEEPSRACGLVYRFSYSMVPEDANSEVRQLQEILQCLGYFPAEQVSTGIFGPITEQAVKDFQAAHGIDSVGYVGPSTIQALNQYTQP
ncbi:DUF11 domain-containing protein [Patescibacteria group bacterium]|nr:DUF11 domain-containing protein [Patescibacteria group bacterium]MBU1705807.1 DUF11 domain-containing protein [Patescibacteria group bacterium]